MKKTLTTVLTGVLLLALTGCYKMDADIKIGSDNTVSGHMIVAVSKDVLAMAEESGGDITEGDDLFDVESFAGDATIEDWENDDFKGEKLTVKNVPLKEFQEGTDLGENESETPELSIVREGDQFVLTIPKTENAGADQMVQMFSMMGKPEIDYSIEFPGKITVHEGAGTVKGNTITLTTEDLLEGKGVKVEADAESSGLPGFMLWVLVALVALLLGGGAILLLLRQPKNNE